MSRAFVIESLEGRTLLSCDPALESATLDPGVKSAIRFVGGEVGTFLTNIQTNLYDKVLGQPMPIIGAPFKGLKGTSKDLIQPLINGVKSITFAASELNLCDLHDKLETILAGGGQNSFDAKVFDPPNWSIGQPIFDAGVDITLRGTLIDKSFKPNFDIGLPALGLKLTGGVNVDLTYVIHLVVGMDQHGVYLNTGIEEPKPGGGTRPVPEVKLNLDVSAPGLTLTGTLGYLKLAATDQGTHLTGQLAIDFQDGPDADTKLRGSEIFSVPQLIKSAKITGNAHVDLHTSVDIADGAFPSLGADLWVDWTFQDVDLLTMKSLQDFGSPPLVEFRNVTLDCGTFLSRFLTPVLKTINDVLEPVRPVLKELRQRVPLLSDIPGLAQEFDANEPGQPGFGEVSILEVLAKLAPNDAIVQFFVTVEQLDNLIGNGRTLPGDNAVLNLSGFRVTGDVRAMARSELTSAQNAVSHINTFLASVPPLPITLGNVINQLKNPTNFGAGQAGFKFPILDNLMSVFGVFLGQPLTLMTFTTPRLSTGPLFDRSFPLIGPLSVRLLGGLRLDAQFSFGFDTLGISEWAAGGYLDATKILDGLYVSDRQNADGTGADVDEVVVQASVKAGLDFSVGFASAMVGGGINGIARLNLNDPNNDGKVRFNEIVEMAGESPLCVFDATGKVFVDFLSTGQIFGVPFTVTFASLDLIQFDHHCPPPGAPPLPDLLATDLQFKASNPNNLRQLDYSFDVVNRGDIATTGNAVATIYLSDDDQITTSDAAWKVINLGAFDQAETRSFAGTITLPNLPFPTDNRYHLGLIVDDANAVTESDETNNVNNGLGTPPYTFAVEGDLPSPAATVASDVVVNATALPFDAPVGGSLVDEIIGPADMDVYQFTVPVVLPPPPGPIASPAAILPPIPRGKLVGLDVDAKGGVNTYLRLFDANWNLIASNDNGLSPAEATSPGGESYIEARLLGGTYYAVVSAAGNNTGDPRLLSGRSSPAFGQGPYVLTLLSDPHALPDLVPTSFVSTGAPSSNFRFVTLNVANQGTGNADSFWVRYYVSEDPTITTADTVIGARVESPLPAGSTVTVQETLDLGGVFGNDDPLRTDNEYFIGAIVNDAPPTSVPIVESHTYNDANNGLGIDRIRISSEANLPSPADGVNVVARPLASSTSGVTAVSDIGDEFIGHYDFDVFKFTVNDAGAQARIDIDPLATFASGVKLPDAYLRLYDSSWTLLAQSTNQLARGETSESPAGAYIEHNFAAPGTYYAVVSSAASGASDPRTLASRSPGSKGGYLIELKVFPFFFQPSDLSINSFTTTSGASAASKDVTTVIANGNAGDANLFEVNYYLSEDASITPGDVLLKSTLVQRLEGSSLLTRNEHLDLPAPWLTDNQYYVGVLLDPDGRVFEDGTVSNNVASFAASAEAHLPVPATGVVPIATPLTLRGPRTGSVGDDEWAGPYDLDTYSFTASPGQSLSIDLNSTRARLIETLHNFAVKQGLDWTVEQTDAAISIENFRNLSRQFRDTLPITIAEIVAAGNLDAFLRLYDANWNLLASNDNAAAPSDGLGWKDPYLAYTFAAQGTYYAVVGSFDTAASDPLRLTARRAGTTHGEYSIALGAAGGSSVYGVVYDDQNVDGSRGENEPGLADVTVYVDVNHNTLLDPGEPRALTDGDGHYALGGLTDGVYTIRHLVREGFATTAPAGGAASAQVAAGERPAQVNFGDTRLITISGSSFDDTNANTERDPADVPLEGRLIFIDFNDNGSPDVGEPSSITDADGAYALALLPGHYILRQELPDGWRATAPRNGAYSLTVAAERRLDNLDFGSVQTGSLSGVAFDDANANGAWDANEAALSNRRIFIDANGNDIWDGGEQNTLTGAAGEWSLRGLLAGSYRLAQELPADWQSTAPAGGSQTIELAPDATPGAIAFGSRLAPGAVVGRHVFYNNSALDGALSAANAGDDAAIAANKQALLPGQTATFANYTNYGRGLNGIMIDIARPALGASLTSADFAFAVPGPAGWSPLAVQPTASVRPGAGDGGSDRVTLIFPDGSIHDTWLRVTVLTNANTRLQSADVCYFGNLVGDTGDGSASSRALVTSADAATTRRNMFRRDAAALERCDFNRDGMVNTLDLMIARAAQRLSLSLMTAPSSPASVAGVAATPFSDSPVLVSPLRPARRSELLA